MRERMRLAGQGTGRFSKASANMATALEQAPSLAAKLRSLDLPPPTADDDQLPIVMKFFQGGITRAAVVVLGPKNQQLTIDSHSPDAAKESPALVADLVQQIAAAFDLLAATPYDSQRSMLDVTTVVVSSEFSRTMRQQGLPIDAMGTDHNPLTNSLLVGGRGVRGSLVFGASDTRTADEEVSGAHRSLDAMGLKIMGKPFDFAAGRPLDVKPKAYVAGDYLGMPSVANTLYELFGVDRGKFWLTERNGITAPALSGLLA
jgi:hypothetical protein